MITKIQPVRTTKKTIAQQVEENIREAIFTETLAPGSRIDQNRLADDLNVSLIPVREALKILATEGLVELVPRRGAFVTEVSAAHMNELYYARQILEGEAIFHAVPHLTDEDFRQLYAMIDTMRTATQADHKHDPQYFLELNRDFHYYIYNILENKYLNQTIHNLNTRSDVYRYRYIRIIRDFEPIHQEHTAIVQACQSCDPARAKELAVQHIRNTQRALEKDLR